MHGLIKEVCYVYKYNYTLSVNFNIDLAYVIKHVVPKLCFVIAAIDKSLNTGYRYVCEQKNIIRKKYISFQSIDID